MNNSQFHISMRCVFLDSLLLTLTAASIYIVSALKIYYGNVTDFVFPISDLVSIAGIWTLFLFAGIGILLFVSHWFLLYRYIAVLLLILIFDLWAQGNLFNWNYGPLDGSPIPWSQFEIEGNIELFFLLTLIPVTFFFARKIYVLMPYALIILTLMQVADSLATIKKTTGPDLDKLFIIDESNKFVFGHEKNIIILILDAFQGSVFGEIMPTTPELTSRLDGFTWFKNASCAIPSTKLSLPNLLSGIAYNNKIPVHQYQREVLLGHSLLVDLKSRGYQTEYYSVFGYGILPVNDRLWSNARRKTSRMELVDEYNKLFQTTNFRVSLQIIKKQLYKNGVWTTKEDTKKYLINALEIEGDQTISNAVTPIMGESKPSTKCCNNIPAGIHPDIDFTNAMLGQVRKGNRSNIFKLYHLQGLHPPRNIDENFNVDPMLNEDSDSIPSSGRASLKLLNLFLGELKKAGVYDNSLIFVLGDHGNARRVNPSGTAHHANLNKKSLRLNFDSVKGTAIPLVLVKPAGATGPLQISEKPVTLGDVPNTAIDLIGGKPGFPGLPMFTDIEPLRERLFWIHAYHEGHFDYYGDLQEFSIKGNIYEDSDWSVTGNLLKPAETGVKKFYEERDVYLKAMLPLKPVEEKGDPFAVPPFGYLNDTCVASRAFDKIPRETTWMPVVAPNGRCASKAILGIEYRHPIVVKVYSLKTRYDLQYEAPKDWTFEASNDNQNWLILHRVINETQWEPGGKVKIFQIIDNSEAYAFYRLNISNSQDGRCISIDEFELFE